MKYIRLARPLPVEKPSSWTWLAKLVYSSGTLQPINRSRQLTTDNLSFSSSLIITGTSGSLEICPTLNLFKQTEVQLPINLKQMWMRLELKRELVLIAGNDSFDWGKYGIATVTQTARYKLNFKWVFFVSFPYTYYVSYMRWF